MGISISTNVAAMTAHQNLAANMARAASAMGAIASGSHGGSDSVALSGVAPAAIAAGGPAIALQLLQAIQEQLAASPLSSLAAQTGLPAANITALV